MEAVVSLSEPSRMCKGSSNVDPMLSGSDLEPSGISGSSTNVNLADVDEFRHQMDEPTYHTLSVAAGTYAMLAPLQPLPPISTVTSSEKYHSSSPASGLGVSTNGFTFIVQQNGFAISPTTLFSLGDYEVKSEILNPHYTVPSTVSTPMVFPTYTDSVQCSMIIEPQCSLKQEPNFNNDFESYVVKPPTSTKNCNSANNGGTPSSTSGPRPTESAVSSLHLQIDSHSVQTQKLLNQAKESKSRVKNPPQPQPSSSSSSTFLNNADESEKEKETEELNTKDVAQRITAELKRYSIPQAIFAQRVLCRSQGTLSDLLRNPKPWSKLKSGRDTFRRMWKWLQEPEFQRMSALRLAGTSVSAHISGHSLRRPIYVQSKSMYLIHTLFI